MSYKVAIGIQNFAKLREKNLFYIDKTTFIKEWWESEDDVTLITRPRRFGKTLNMSMLEQFFSVDYANRGDLFEGLSVWEDEKYRTLQGTYPVISLSFAGIKERDYITTRERICQLLTKLYVKYSYLKDSNVLENADRAYFNRMMEVEIRDSDVTLAIHNLCDYMSRYYGKKVIVLLDEYDTPMQEAYVHGYWEELVALTRSMFNSTFKTNPYMERGIMTGITRVSKESIFSDLNNLEVVTTTSNKYATSFGFTEEEVCDALDKSGMENETEEVTRWYDGFVFGKYRDIYNPWSILNFLSKGEYNSYWSNTSGNGLVSKLIREGSMRVKTSFEKLLKGETIICPIDEQIVFNQLNGSEAAIWSLLVASGYLKVIRREYGGQYSGLLETKRLDYELDITNLEVRIMFERMVQDWFSEDDEDYGEFVTALLRGDLKAMNYYMKNLVLQTFSFFDTGKGKRGDEPERFYHGFVLGLLVELKADYVVTSNRESGFGRYDVMLEPRDKSRDGMILEFKAHDPEDESDLEETIQAALAQIEEKQYEANLIAAGVAKERIRKYAFAFQGKTVRIGEKR